MIDTSELEVEHEGDNPCNDVWVVSSKCGMHLFRGTRYGAWAYLAGAAQEQVRQLKAENERLKRRVELREQDA